MDVIKQSGELLLHASTCCFSFLTAGSETKTLLSFSCCNLHYFTYVLCYTNFKIKLRGLLV